MKPRCGLTPFKVLLALEISILLIKSDSTFWYWLMTCVIMVLMRLAQFVSEKTWFWTCEIREKKLLHTNFIRWWQLILQKPRIIRTFTKKWVRNVYTTLLLMKTRSSTRILLIYSAKTGSSHSNLMQFFASGVCRLRDPEIRGKK